MLKGNKGEWSEVYTLLKLLGDTEIYGGDENLNKIPDLLYPIIKILRDESNGHFEYSVNDNLILITGKNESLTVPVHVFREKSIILLKKIKEARSSSFYIPEIEEFLSQINCSSLKAKSSSKTDIKIVIHDLRTNLQHELGFSIKSQLGNASTLLNAGKSTNFIYRIFNCNLTSDFIEEVNLINTRSKIKDRLERLLNNGCEIQFKCTEQELFENNLILIDSKLPNILAEIVFDFYATSTNTIKDLVDTVENQNPLNFNTSNNHRFYEYKIKKFLTEVALGMMPASVWNGLYDATGGYLVVKEDGEVLSYHIYNKNKFEEYLYHNTKLETASSRRHDFGKIYKDGNEYFIKLNLQIRFKK